MSAPLPNTIGSGVFLYVIEIYVIMWYTYDIHAKILT